MIHLGLMQTLCVQKFSLNRHIRPHTLFNKLRSYDDIELQSISDASFPINHDE